MKKKEKKNSKKKKKRTPRQEVKNKIKKKQSETKIEEWKAEFLYKRNAKIGRQRNSKQQKKKS